ncbi:MAG: hypothetical protein PHY03_04830 [Dehalococcoidia bacterium]|nr:hypothetical protein [Dehalococcoidia bacterium]
MRIYLYLTGIFVLFIALLPVLGPSPVEGQGCAGGKCGITTTLTPNSGPTGTQVSIMIESGTYPLDGKYEIWFSKSATMAVGSSDPDSDGSDPTAVKLAEGWNERLKQSMSLSLSVPQAVNGTNYFHYIKAGRAAQMINFAFNVTPGLVCKDEKLLPRSTASISGSGFTASDQIQLYIDGEPLDLALESDTSGCFTTSVPVPDLMAGTHVMKATAKKMYNQEATLRFKISPYIVIEPSIPLAGKSATVSGYGFAPGSEVSIKYDDAVVTSSPTSDKSGRFTYNFTVPETSAGKHTLVATDRAGNMANWELPVENNPPTSPAPVSPTTDRFGVMGGQPVTFTWIGGKDDSGTVLYTVEVADNLNFFPLMPGMRRSGITETSVTMNIEPGTYYWRVQSVDVSGNKSKWALSPYAFQVGLINLWVVAGVSLVLIVIFILLLRAFIQRVRGYYY